MIGGTRENQNHMFGRQQKATTRIPIDASGDRLRQCLTEANLLRQWVWPQTLDKDLPARLELGNQFYSHLGPLNIGHEVRELDNEHLTLALWGAIDGYNEWRWGDGWVQLHIEAVSLIPLKLGLNVTLQQLKQFASQASHDKNSA